jgi:hypothetical protein
MDGSWMTSLRLRGYSSLNEKSRDLIFRSLLSLTSSSVPSEVLSLKFFGMWVWAKVFVICLEVINFSLKLVPSGGDGVIYFTKLEF